MLQKKHIILISVLCSLVVLSIIGTALANTVFKDRKAEDVFRSLRAAKKAKKPDLCKSVKCPKRFFCNKATGNCVSKAKCKADKDCPGSTTCENGECGCEPGYIETP